MKAKIIHAAHGLPAGAEVDVIETSVHTATIRVSETFNTVINKDELEFLSEEPEALPAAQGLRVVDAIGDGSLSAGPPEFVWPTTIVPRLEVAAEIEAEARALYDDYSAATGGAAFNGAPLPPAVVFFEDERTQKQANAWRVAAGNSYERFVQAAIAGGEGIEDPDHFTRAKLEVMLAKPHEDGKGETLILRAVPALNYGEDGMDEDNSYAHFSPTAEFEISVRNENLLGKAFPGSRYYADLTEAPDSAPRKPAESAEPVEPAQEENPPAEGTGAIEEVKSGEDNELPPADAPDAAAETVVDSKEDPASKDDADL